MELVRKNIAFVLSFEAPYGGNILKMLYALSELLAAKYEMGIHFIFPEQQEKEWLSVLKKKYKVGFTRKPYESSADDIYKLLSGWNIDIVHTHFDNYDIPVAKAITRSKRDIKHVVHLHDYLSFDKTGLSLPWLRKRKTNFDLWKRYGWYCRKAYFIGVSAEVTNIATHYRNHFFSLPSSYPDEVLEKMRFNRAEVLLNGIDMSRLEGEYHKPSGSFSFLTFGGEARGKGIPCILDAAELVWREGYDFSLSITNGYTLQSYLQQRYPQELPDFLKIVGQTEKITDLFDSSHCYISASKYETMSMSIAEASIYGLPVIQSDIPGTYWNSLCPSTFVFEVDNARMLALRMIEVMGYDKIQLQEKCKETRVYNKERLKMSVWCDRVVSVYKKL